MCRGAGQVINMKAELQPAKLAQKPIQSIIRFIEMSPLCIRCYALGITGAEWLTFTSCTICGRFTPFIAVISYLESILTNHENAVFCEVDHPIHMCSTVFVGEIYRMVWRWFMVEAVPAATVAPLRDGADGLEVLLLRRNANLEFVGGAWVFPGGRIDPEDYQTGNSTELEAAYCAAVRECREEADLVIEASELVCISHWTTPEVAPKRFATWFFLAAANSHRQVVVDGGEIHGYQWVRPSVAIEQYHAGEILIILPTYRTLEQIAKYPTVSAAIDAHVSQEPVIVPVSESRMEAP